MAISFVITIDGVLAEQGDEESFAASKIVVEGVYLYRALDSFASVSLVSLQDESEKDKVDYWLKIHRLDGHDQLLYDPHPSDPERGVPKVLDHLRRSGPVDLVIESSAERAAWFLHHGAATSVLARPSYTRSEFRPDGTRIPRSWDAVVAELDAQRGISEEDFRLTRGGSSKYME